MDMAIELENPIPPVDFLPKWGIRKRMSCVKPQVKQVEAVTDKKPAIHVDKRVFRANKEEYAAESTISSQEQHYQVKLAVDKKISVPCNNSSHSSAARPERGLRLQQPINNIMSTRSSNYTDQTNIMQHNKPLNSEPLIWPKVCLTLPLAQIEEDFLAIKGSKLPLKPKKRLKSIQRTIHIVSPGGWLNDISQERYEVREKKCTKKRPRGLKSMRKAESDSE